MAGAGSAAADAGIDSLAEGEAQLGRDVLVQLPPRTQGGSKTTMALMEACRAVLRGPNRSEAAPVHRPVRVQLWLVEQALARIRKKLAEDPEGRALAHVLPVVGQVRTGCGRREVR